MDILYFRPNSIQLYRDWKEFKKDKYKTLTAECSSSDPPEPLTYRHLNCKYNRNQTNCFERTPLHWLMSYLDNDLYELILWEERVANRLRNLPLFLEDHFLYDWLKYRSIEVIDEARGKSLRYYNSL